MTLYEIYIVITSFSPQNNSKYFTHSPELTCSQQPQIYFSHATPTGVH